MFHRGLDDYVDTFICNFNLLYIKISTYLPTNAKEVTPTMTAFESSLQINEPPESPSQVLFGLLDAQTSHGKLYSM